MRRFAFVGVFIILLLMCCLYLVSKKDSSDNEKRGIPINDVMFPDFYFRGFVSNYIDKNKDGYISEDENRCIRSLSCHKKGITAVIADEGKEKEIQIYNDKQEQSMHYDGIQCFRYVDYLHIGALEAFRNKELEISDFPYIKTLELYSKDDNLDVTLSNLDSIKNVEIHNSSMPNLIDNGTKYGKIIINNVSKLESVSIENASEFTIDSCESLQYLDLFRVSFCPKDEIKENCPNLWYFSYNGI